MGDCGWVSGKQEDPRWIRPIAKIGLPQTINAVYATVWTGGISLSSPFDLKKTLDGILRYENGSDSRPLHKLEVFFFSSFPSFNVPIPQSQLQRYQTVGLRSRALIGSVQFDMFGPYDPSNSIRSISTRFDWQVRETMRIMGLHAWTHELSWLATGTAVFTFIAISVSALLSWTFLPLADGSLVLVFMLSFVVSEVGMALLVSSFFSKVIGAFGAFGFCSRVEVDTRHRYVVSLRFVFSHNAGKLKSCCNYYFLCKYIPGTSACELSRLDCYSSALLAVYGGGP